MGIAETWLNLDPKYPAPANARVYVVDDDSQVRTSLHFLLATIGITAWPFASAEDFLEQQPTLDSAPVLLDVQLSGLSGIDLLVELERRRVTWPVIVMTAFGSIATAVRALKLGALDFFEKPLELEEIESALTLAFAKLAEASEATERGETARMLLARLTPREAEVLKGLMRGLPNKIVAHELDLSTRTVEMHRAHALSKLRVRTIAEVVAIVAGAGVNSRPEFGP